MHRFAAQMDFQLSKGWDSYGQNLRPHIQGNCDQLCCSSRKPYLTPIIVSSNLLGCSLKGKRSTGSDHKTSLITVRSSLLLHLLSSLVSPSALTFRSHLRTVATLARHLPLKLNYIFNLYLYSHPPLQILHLFSV